MHGIQIFTTVLACCAATPAVAASITVQMLGTDGLPVAGRMLTLAPPGTPLPSVRERYAIAQRHIRFASPA